MVIERRDMPGDLPEGPCAEPPGSPVLIEPMHRRHLRDVVRIEEATNPRPWSRRLFASELRSPDSRIYRIARCGREIVGYAGLMLVAGEGHITNIGVDPAFRRRGIATRLMIDVSHGAIGAGAVSMTLEVRMSNSAAQDLYRRFGFAPAGVRERYYPPPDRRPVDGASRATDSLRANDGAEDALVMWAADVDSGAYHDRLTAIAAGLDRSSTDHDGIAHE